MPKRRQLTAETPKDDLRNAHDRALEVISSDAELPVDGILPRDEFDWIKTFIDENPRTSLRIEKELSGLPTNNGTRYYATAYTSSTSTRARTARISTSSSPRLVSGKEA